MSAEFIGKEFVAKLNEQLAERDPLYGPKKPSGMSWRQYPPAPKEGNPQKRVILHDCDQFSTKAPSPAAAKVIARVLAMRPSRPPGRAA